MKSLALRPILLALLALFSPWVTAPTRAQTVYHDQTLAFHQARYATLASAGYRPVAIDVAGDLQNQRWSAIWEQRGGLPWTADFGRSETAFASWRTARLAEGYRDTWITSSGAGANRVYGGIMVQGGQVPIVGLDFTRDDVEDAVEQAHDTDRLLVSASVHGTASNPRFAVVFADNPNGVRWGYSLGDTASSYQEVFDTFVGKCWSRPAIVTTSDSQSYLSVFHDDEVGEWVARHGLTKRSYETTEATLAGQGYQPCQIMVSGLGSAARYAALFVRGTPASYQVTTTGPGVPAFAPIDDLIVGPTGSRGGGFMQQNNAREAAIAIAKDGRLVFARGYTYAVPGAPITQPTSGFRVASLSKSVSAIAFFHLMQGRSLITTRSKLVDLVALGTPRDPRVNDMRMQHLIDHTSGYTGTWPTTVVNKLQQARNDIQNEWLLSPPGTSAKYSNSGFQMLGLVIEEQTGSTYWDYVRQNLLAPLDITRSHLITSGPVSGDVRCQEGSWGGSRLLQVSRTTLLPWWPLVNRAYDVTPVSMDASGGLVMSPVDYVRLLSGVFDRPLGTSILNPASLAELEQMIQAQGITGGWDSAQLRQARVPYYYYKKGGLWRSAHAWGVRRTDGVSIGVFCTGPIGPSIEAINAIVDQVDIANAWPTHDLFSSYGLPAFEPLVAGSAVAYGAGCAGSAGIVAHTSSGTPEIGSEQTLSVTTAKPLALASFMLGLSRTTLQGLPLPLELGLVGASGCWLHMAPAVTVPLQVGTLGTTGIELAYPLLPSLVGAKLFSQFLVVDAGANLLGMVFSNGIETTIGG